MTHPNRRTLTTYLDNIHNFRINIQKCIQMGRRAHWLLVAVGLVFAAISTCPAISQQDTPSNPPLMAISTVNGRLPIYVPGQPIRWNIHLGLPIQGSRVSFAVRNWKGEIEQEIGDLRPSDRDLQIACE